MSNYALSASARKLFGRKVKSLRRQGVIPGNVFGAKTKSVAIQMNLKPLLETLKKAGETALIDLKIEGESKARPVLVAGYAQDPVSGAMQHVDFHEVDLTVKTTATVPVKTVGTSSAVAAGNVLVMLKNEIEVEALPADLPESIEVDISGLAEVGATIHAKDLKVDRAKVKLELEDEEPIVTVQEPAKEEVVEAPVADSSAEALAKTEGDKPAADSSAEAPAKAEGDKPDGAKPKKE